MNPPLECVANISEGRDERILGLLELACAPTLIDRHTDWHHHRSVFTLAGEPGAVEESARRLVGAAVEHLDIRSHHGEHPRFGLADVVPFVSLDPDGSMSAAAAARDRFADWAAAELSVPCFLYGPLPGGSSRTLPEVRRNAFRSLEPDFGSTDPHPSAGAMAVGARPPLVAFNLWIEGVDLGLAKQAASAIRGPHVRSLAFDLGGSVQVSCNLVDPMIIGPVIVYDQVVQYLLATGGTVARVEVVGLVPESVLQTVPRGRWEQLDLSPDATIEARLKS